MSTESRFDFTGGRNPTKYKVYGEHFNTMSEIVTTLENRTPVDRSSKHREHDFFGRVNGLCCSKDWNGFRDRDELMDVITMGVQDADRVTTIKQFSRNIKIGERRNKKVFDCGGDEVDIGRYCSHEPECMIDSVYKRTQSRGVKLVVDIGALCDVTANDYSRCGNHLARLIKTLEQAKYRVNLIGCGCNVDYDHDIINLMTVTLKRADAPVNYPRLLFGFSPMFFRGLTFGWFAKSTLYCHGLGRSLGCYFDYGDIHSLFRQHLHDDKIVIERLEDLVKRCKSDKDDEILDWLVDDVKIKMRTR